MSAVLEEAVDEQVTHIGAMVLGAEQALARFMEGQLVAEDPSPSYFALFETLNWITALDERKDLRRADRPEVLRAMRYARNVVHHQWADALMLDASGFTFPMQIPLVFHEWRWRSLEDMPSPSSRHLRVNDQRAFAEVLAGSPARLSLQASVAYFATATE